MRAPAKLGRLRPCPRQANGALGSPLPHRAGAGCAVALLEDAIACAVVSRAPTPWERACASACATWVESPKRGARAPAKLWQLHSYPKQANGALSSALLHRAGAGSAEVLLVVAVACAAVSRAPAPWERACATACATLGREPKTRRARPGQARTASSMPYASEWCLGLRSLSPCLRRLRYDAAGGHRRVY